MSLHSLYKRSVEFCREDNPHELAPCISPACSVCGREEALQEQLRVARGSVENMQRLHEMGQSQLFEVKAKSGMEWGCLRSAQYCIYSTSLVELFEVKAKSGMVCIAQVQYTAACIVLRRFTCLRSS